MARIKYGPIIADISGSVGSATFQKNLYGNTLRTRPRNTKTGTTPQLHARSLMMQCQASWKIQSAAIRKQWNQYVAFSGASINRDRGILMTGHSLYLKYNFARLLAGLAILNTLVYISMPAHPTVDPSYFCASDGVDMILSLTDVYDETLVFCLIKLSGSRSPSQAFSKSGLRNISLTYDGSGTFAIKVPYAAIFGYVPPSGITLHYSVQWFALTAPLTSSPLTGTCLIIAL